VNALLHRGGPLSDGSESDRPGIVHRLDKDTSGVMIVARTNRVHAAMSVLFATRKVDKEYAGICIGAHPAEHGTIDAPLGRSRSEPVKRAVRRGGKQALTEYWLMGHQGGVSAIRFRLHSGRTHQIRVHCRHAGFPIVADTLYGGSSLAIKRLQPMDRPFAYAIFRCFQRHALHARRLSFEHPITGEPVTVTAPFPDDFRDALREFGIVES
jgi:23S rRNA pseudouridine1911/1915/1917 synthase